LDPTHQVIEPEAMSCLISRSRSKVLGRNDLHLGAGHRLPLGDAGVELFVLRAADQLHLERVAVELSVVEILRHRGAAEQRQRARREQRRRQFLGHVILLLRPFFTLASHRA
jgi:hypothetical protein